MTDLFERFTSRENLKKAYEFIKVELVSVSISVDPVMYPFIEAIDTIGDAFFIAMERYLRSGIYKSEKASHIFYPKDNYGMRPVALMSLIDRIIYQAILNPKILGYKIDSQLQDKLCLSHRVNLEENKDRYLINYKELWDELVDRQRVAFEEGFVWKIELDVQGYYENIIHSKLNDKLKNEFGIKDEGLLRVLQEILLAQCEYTELPKSVPQGLWASDVLANVYLNSLDVFSSSFIQENKIRYFRYVDDICIFTKTREGALAITEKFAYFLRREGLNVNSKTAVTKLQNVSDIEKNRLHPSYEEDLFDGNFSEPENDIPEFENISINARDTINKYLSSEYVDDEKIRFREVKYFINKIVTADFDLLDSIMELIKIKPSLTPQIIRCVTSNVDEDGFLAELHLDKLIDIYCSLETRELSKFWILKLLVTFKYRNDFVLNELEKKSKENELYLLLFVYYYVSNNIEIDSTKYKLLSSLSKTKIVFAHILFFYKLSGLDDNKEKAFIIENSLSEDSHDINLIGLFLFGKTSIEIKSKLLLGKFSKFFNEEIKNENLNFLNIDKNKYRLVLKKSIFEIDEVLGTSRRQYIPNNPVAYVDVYEVDLSFEKLCSWKDGRITYDGVVMDMRPQIKDLCRLFLKRPRAQITYDDIKDSIIKSRSRDTTPNSTLSKYVHELIKSLDAHSKTLEIINNPLTGYTLTYK